MNPRRMTLLAWTLFGLIAVTVAAGVIFLLVNKPAEGEFSPNSLIDPFVTVGFAFVGALIISRQPRNAIGWLLMLPGLSFTFLVNAYLEPFLNDSFIPPESPAPIFLLILWFSNLNWMMWLFPTMFIMVLFPTGRPLNRRWGRVNYLGLSVIGFFILGVTFIKNLSPDAEGVEWTVRNPIGFLEGGEWLAPVFLFSFVLWIFLSAVSLFVRFHNARGIEREQIKWLFFACAVFAVGYIFAVFNVVPSGYVGLWSLLGSFMLLAIPASIAIAILRYRLYDIDLIIRRTLQYTLLSGVLAGVYFGSVVLLQSLIGQFTGKQSPAVIVISTLAIVVLFNPLRTRVQDFIDRRFYRQKYDAERALAEFAATARDEVELEKLTTALLSVVEETVQPDQISLWLKYERR